MSAPIDPAALAAELSQGERVALLALQADDWGAAPPEALAKSLMLGHGVALIATLGDWAMPTRIGAKVQMELRRRGGAS